MGRVLDIDVKSENSSIEKTEPKHEKKFYKQLHPLSIDLLRFGGR